MTREEHIEIIASYIYLGQLDVLGYPNGDQPTWQQMVKFANEGSTEFKFRVAQIRCGAEYAWEYCTRVQGEKV